MNYIKQLQEERRELFHQIDIYRKGISDIYRYLNLPKFQEDTTVQKSDIFNRLRDIDNNLFREGLS